MSMTQLGWIIVIGLPFAVVALVIWWPSDYNDPPP